MHGGTFCESGLDLMALKIKVKQKTPTTLADEALSVRFAHDAENYAAAAMMP